MKERSEAFLCIKSFVEVKLKAHGCSIKHFHADGGKELISQPVINLFKISGQYLFGHLQTHLS